MLNMSTPPPSGVPSSFNHFNQCYPGLAGGAQTVALDHYADLVDTMMGRFVAINSGVERTVSLLFTPVWGYNLQNL